MWALRPFGENHRPEAEAWVILPCVNGLAFARLESAGEDGIRVGYPQSTFPPTAALFELYDPLVEAQT